MSSKISIWKAERGELRPAGFHYAGYTASCAATLGNYALLGDACRGLQLVAWSKEKKCFEARSQRRDAASAFACEMTLDEAGPHAANGLTNSEIHFVNLSQFVSGGPAPRRRTS